MRTSRKTHRLRCVYNLNVALALSLQLRPRAWQHRQRRPAVKFPQFPPFPLPFKPFLPPHHSSKTFASRAEMGSVFRRRRRRFSRYFYNYLGKIFYFSDRCLSLPPLRLSASASIRLRLKDCGSRGASPAATPNKRRGAEQMAMGVSFLRAEKKSPKDRAHQIGTCAVK